MFKNIKNLVSISLLDGKKTVNLLSEWKSPEAVIQRCSVKMFFLEISQNSQENTALKSLFIGVTDLKCFHVNSAKFLKAPFL